MRFLTYYFFFLANLIIANDKGMELFNSGNYKEAAEYYSSILKERIKDNAANFSLGASHYYMEDHLSALKRFEQVLSSEDRMLQSKALYNIARILQDQNELDKSLSLYKKSLQLNPNDIDSKINYELLKKMINQQNSQQQQSEQNQESSEEQQSDQGQEGSEQQQSDQNQESSEEQQSDQGQEGSEQQQSDQGQEGSEQQQSDQNQESSEEQQSDQGQEGSEQQQSDQGQEGSEQQQNSSKSQIEDNRESEKSDQIRQAEAILNAIKGQEKINQKHKILKSKSFKLDKDW